MSMSKKDYVNTANILRAQYNALPKTRKGEKVVPVAAQKLMDNLILNFVDLFKRDNPKFDKQRFLDVTIPSWDRERWGMDPRPTTTQVPTVPRQRRGQ